MDIESPRDNDGNGWIDASLTPVNVVVCILECTLSGTTYRMHQQRLLDVLHSSLVANSHRLGKEFVPLTDVDLFFCSGEKEHLESTHVNKWSVLFVAERSGGQPSASSLPETERPSFRPKKALSARVRIPPYDLVGKMHADPGLGTGSCTRRRRDVLADDRRHHYTSLADWRMAIQFRGSQQASDCPY